MTEKTKGIILVVLVALAAGKIGKGCVASSAGCPICHPNNNRRQPHEDN